jgi:Protein of unknown function (DUF3300)
VQRDPWKKAGIAGFFAALIALLVALAPAPGVAQNYPTPAAAPVFSPQQLDQLLAPVALYPDALLAQVLMAATYPLDVVAADRWVREPANAQLRGDALAAALDQQPWDPSVKSLVPFPQVLAMMDSRLDWLQQLGDAFLAQPNDVMAAVQRLRQQAQAAGTLVSTAQETVENQNGTIVIVPANPNVVYVPYYNPSVAYGAWEYPNYPPIYLAPPPGFVVSGFFFGLGVGIVAPLWGWGDFDWHRHEIHIDRDRFNRINRGRPPVTSTTWHFDPSRRGAVPYRDVGTRARYQRPLPGPAPSRDFRGYAPQQAARPAPQARPPAARPQAQPAARPRVEPQTARPTAPQARPPAARPETQPAARPQVEPQTARPAAPPPRQPAARPSVQTAHPAPAARPVAPQVFRPPAPTSAFQPSAGANVRTYSQRGAQSRAAPVARPAPAPHVAPAARPAPAARAAPAPHPAPSPQGGQHR